MITTRKKLLALATFFVSINVSAEIAVIVHPDNKTNLTEKEIRDLYLLKDRYFPDGKPVKVYNLSGDDEAKNDFYNKVLHKDESRVNSQWVRALFSSKATPPKDLKTAQMMKAAVASNPDAIGFIDAKDIDDSVRVILKK